MELNVYFNAILENAERPLVLCDTDFRVIFLNRIASELYEKKHGKKLLGNSVRTLMSEDGLSRLDAAIEWFKESPDNQKVFVCHSESNNSDVYIKAVRDDNGKVIGFYNYLDYRNPETGKVYDLD
ncbi:MAG: PAS domain-containing protein [Ruminococcus sp.]|nr:PAS domain-containing protein [Ruminococcus sp.]